MSEKKVQSWWSSTFNYTCPRCRKGDLFIKPMQVSTPLAMHKRCSSCNLNFTPEPGYYYGAMFLSYILSGWALLLVALGLVFYYEWSVESAMLVVIAIGALSYFFLMRFSRSLYIHLLVRHQSDQPEQQK